MKKIKKIIFLIFLTLIVYLIYVTTLDKKIYYLALGDSLAAGVNPYGVIGYGYSDYIHNYLKEKEVLEFYTKGFAVSGYRTTDLIKDIEENKQISANNEKETIKHALTKADLITLSIGANDLFYKMGISDMKFNIDSIDRVYDYIDEIMEDVDSLISLIEKYNNGNIIILGYYNPLISFSSSLSEELEPLFVYGNASLKQIADNHQIYYVDIYNLFKENKEYLPNPLDIHPDTKGYEAISKEIIKFLENNILK